VNHVYPLPRQNIVLSIRQLISVSVGVGTPLIARLSLTQPLDSDNVFVLCYFVYQYRVRLLVLLFRVSCSHVLAECVML